jgi:hypothetical protein
VVRHHLNRAHVNLIKIWPFLSINFDVDEVFVHQTRNCFVLKRFVLHYVTPVTRGITDAQQDGFLFAASSFERFIAPGKPIDWVVSVLQEVGTCLVDKPVRKCVFCHLALFQLLGLQHSTVWHEVSTTSR